MNPLLRSYGPWGSGAHVSYPSGRLVNDVRERVARERDAPAGFTPCVLATFERQPELIDVAARHLLERHFAPATSGDPRSGRPRARHPGRYLPA